MTLCRTLAVVTALAGIPQVGFAASAADVAKALAPEVLQVVSGGTWKDGDKTGDYRAVLIAPGGGAAAELVVQWLSPGAAGAPPSVVASATVKEVADLKLADATLNAEVGGDNDYTVFVEPDDPSKDNGQSYTVSAGAPGKYTFNVGAPPE